MFQGWFGGSPKMVENTACGALWHIFHQRKLGQQVGRKYSIQTFLNRIRELEEFFLFKWLRTLNCNTKFKIGIHFFKTCSG
jgi:hypothetical protein